MSHAGHFALDSLTTLTASMGSATGTLQPRAQVWYHDVPVSVKEGFEEYRTQLQRTALNDTTAVDICSPPTNAETYRAITKVSLVNRSSDTEIITIATVIGGTSFQVIVVTLTTFKCLFYEEGRGWYTEGG